MSEPQPVGEPGGGGGVSVVRLLYQVTMPLTQLSGSVSLEKIFSALNIIYYSPGYHPCSALGFTKAEPREGDNQGRNNIHVYIPPKYWPVALPVGCCSSRSRRNTARCFLARSLARSLSARAALGWGRNVNESEHQLSPRRERFHKGTRHKPRALRGERVASLKTVTWTASPLIFP